MTQQQTRVTVVHLLAESCTLRCQAKRKSMKSGAKKGTAKKKSSRKVLSLEEKSKVVRAIKSGKKQAEVAQRFDTPLSQSTVATIVRSKKEIISAYKGSLYKDKRKRMKQPSYPDVEKALAEWFKKSAKH